MSSRRRLLSHADRVGPSLCACCCGQPHAHTHTHWYKLLGDFGSAINPFIVGLDNICVRLWQVIVLFLRPPWRVRAHPSPLMAALHGGLDVLAYMLDTIFHFLLIIFTVNFITSSDLPDDHHNIPEIQWHPKIHFLKIKQQKIQRCYIKTHLRRHFFCSIFAYMNC